MTTDKVTLSPTVDRSVSLSAKKMVIKVPPISERTWKYVEELPYSAEEIVQIVHRYCDAQDHAKNYRVNRAARVKAALEFMADHESEG